MLKQLAFYILCSILVVLFSHSVHTVIVFIDTLYIQSLLFLNALFSPAGSGFFVLKVLALSAIPILIVGAPALVYRTIQGKTMAYFMPLIWVAWLIIVLSYLLVR